MEPRNRVVELRRELAWTRTELARQAGVALATVVRMETGQVTREDSKLKISKALGRSYGYVFPSGK